MNSVEGFILAGGASSRMGTDKSKLVLEGRTFIECVRAALSPIASQITLVGAREKSEKRIGSSLPIVADVVEAWGALGGLHAALSVCNADWAIVVACDLPFVSGDLFSRLASFHEHFDAVAPVQNDGWPQPLCAFYRVAPCLRLADKLIQSGERRPVTLLQSVRTRWVAFNELEDLDGADRFFDNINSPDDYTRALGKGAAQTRQTD